MKIMKIMSVVNRRHPSEIKKKEKAIGIQKSTRTEQIGWRLFEKESHWLKASTSPSSLQNQKKRESHWNSKVNKNRTESASCAAAAENTQILLTRRGMNAENLIPKRGAIEYNRKI